MKKQHRRDIIFVLSVLIIAAILWAGNLLLRKPAGMVRVTADGRLVGEYSLGRDGEYLIEGHGGGTNRLVVRDGRATMDEASCPDQVCVRQGPISQDGQVIVCMPNRVLVQVTESPSP